MLSVLFASRHTKTVFTAAAAAALLMASNAGAPDTSQMISNKVVDGLKLKVKPIEKKKYELSTEREAFEQVIDYYFDELSRIKKYNVSREHVIELLKSKRPEPFAFYDKGAGGYILTRPVSEDDKHLLGQDYLRRIILLSQSPLFFDPIFDRVRKDPNISNNRPPLESAIDQMIEKGNNFFTMDDDQLKNFDDATIRQKVLTWVESSSK